MQREFECDSCRELLVTIQTLPGRDVGNRTDHHPEKSESRKDRQKYSYREIASLEIRAGFFRALTHRLKARHQPRHDLPNQQNGEKGTMAKKRIEVRGRPVFRSSYGKDNDER